MTFTATCPRCNEPIEIDVALEIGTVTECGNSFYVDISGSFVEQMAIDEHLKVCP